MKKFIAALPVALILSGAQAGADAKTAAAPIKTELNAWAQVWYQRVGEAQQGTKLNDFDAFAS